MSVGGALCPWFGLFRPWACSERHFPLILAENHLSGSFLRLLSCSETLYHPWDHCALIRCAAALNPSQNKCFNRYWPSEVVVGALMASISTLLYPPKAKFPPCFPCIKPVRKCVSRKMTLTRLSTATMHPYHLTMTTLVDMKRWKWSATRSW